MSEFGKILNSAIDAAQELAGDMKAATDKMIDTAQEQAPSVVASAREKRQALTDQARENIPGLIDEAKNATEKAMDDAKAVSDKLMDTAKEVGDKAAEMAKEVSQRNANKAGSRFSRFLLGLSRGENNGMHISRGGLRPSSFILAACSCLHNIIRLRLTLASPLWAYLRIRFRYFSWQRGWDWAYLFCSWSRRFCIFVFRCAIWAHA